MSYLKTAGLVIVLLVIGYLLLPYVKIKPKTTTPTQNNINQSNNGAASSTIQTFNSDKLGISFKFDPDQDGDTKPDTDVKEVGDKVYVYYTAGPMEQGQWVQEFTKDTTETLTAAIQKKFLVNFNAKDCFVQTIPEYYTSYGVDVPPIPANIEEAVIAYPKSTDPTQPYWQNAEKCPATYSATNGISYFYLDKNHPDKYFFFSIGQYAIASDPKIQQTWQDTFQVK